MTGKETTFSQLIQGTQNHLQSQKWKAYYSQVKLWKTLHSLSWKEMHVIRDCHQENIQFTYTKRKTCHLRKLLEKSRPLTIEVMENTPLQITRPLLNAPVERRTKHQNITYSPAHSISKQGSRYDPLVSPSKPSSGGLHMNCPWHPSMRHSRERGSSQRNHHIKRRRRTRRRRIRRNRSQGKTPFTIRKWKKHQLPYECILLMTEIKESLSYRTTMRIRNSHDWGL